MTSKASSQDTAVNSPFLSYLPALFRNIGWVRRSWPYMILERKYPFTQLRPRLTSDLMSPWVATTRLSLVATMTLHPVPQNRQAALSHFSSLALRSLTRLAASAGTGIPAAAAAIAAASSLSSWRRSSLAVMRFLPASGSLWRLGRLNGVKDKRGGMHMRQQRDGGENGAKRAAIGRIDHDDELSPGI